MTWDDIWKSYVEAVDCLYIAKRDLDSLAVKKQQRFVNKADKMLVCFLRFRKRGVELAKGTESR